MIKILEFQDNEDTISELIWYVGVIIVMSIPFMRNNSDMLENFGLSLMTLVCLVVTKIVLGWIFDEIDNG